MTQAEVKEIKGNIMGTTCIEMKVKPMRKAQSFTIYPMKDQNKYAYLQSEKRVSVINLETGEGLMSENHNDHPMFAHLNTDNLTKFELTSLDFQALRMQIFASAGKEVGNKGVKTDNSGASEIL